MIDSHCHLDFEPLYSNLNDIIKRSKEVGIKKILTICTTLESFDKIKEIVKKDEMIFGTYGIHPHETKNNKISTDLIINEIDKSDDYTKLCRETSNVITDKSDREKTIKSLSEMTASDKIVHQKELFAYQIIAEEWNMYRGE